MIYAKIENGVVVQIVNTRNDRFVFYYRKIFKTFITWIRIDKLDPQPQLGWSYDPDNGFSND